MQDTSTAREAQPSPSDKQAGIPPIDLSKFDPEQRTIAEKLLREAQEKWPRAQEFMLISSACGIPQLVTPVMRPLPELVKLIKEDLQQGDEAARRAGLPYYQAAGAKMLEAKAQMKHGEFGPRLKRNFRISARHARNYMSLAKATAGQNGSALPFSSLTDAIRQTNPNYNRRPKFDEETIKRLQAENKRHLADAVQRAEAREAKRQLALKIIDLGYRDLATKLHPDKGGSQEQMALLNEARAFLRAAA